ncbi:MAG: hypothetical protein JXB49_26360 [Bacteroidales bacterium]|nr:hypothetical protein [Bacteroidales bacterium]
MKKIKFYVIHLLCLVLFITTACKKDEVEKGSLSLENIQALIDSAKTGDVITLPEGTVTWDNALSIDKGITIQGAGMDKTIIINGSAESGKNVIYVDGNEGEQFIIKGITFKGALGTADDKANTIFIAGNCKNFRITNCKFMDGGSHSIGTRGDTYGVIDHCEFINASQECIVVFHYGTGDNSWTQGDMFGTANAVYVEDCNFDFVTRGDHAIVSNNGGRYVFRYNTITSAKERNSTQIDAHGNFFADRGTYSVEIYENTLNSGRSWYGMYIRGGSGVIFNNTFTGDYPNPITFTNYRSWEPDLTTPCGYVACDYPAPDQINNFYIWNNIVNGSEAGISFMDRGLETEHIQENRDYFLVEKPGYEPYAYPHPLTLDK